jgi:hypothetical protein
MGEDLVVGLQVSDVREKGPARAHYALHVRRGVLEVRPEAPSNPAFTLITDLATWKDLVLGRLLPPLAVSQHQVVIAGADPTAFYAFMNLFN